MLEELDLSPTLAKDAYKAALRRMDIRLGALQRTLLDRRIPAIVVFEGWDAAGKGELINELIQRLDPRGFKVHCVHVLSREEKLRPFLWPYWIRTPARGRIAVFDQGWCGRIVDDCMAGRRHSRDVAEAYADIRAFERQLADDGTLLIKFFLHISRGEQKKRFAALRSDPNTAWRVADDNEDQNRRYRKCRRFFEEMLAGTTGKESPWNVLEAHDRRWAAMRMFETVAAAMERGIAASRRAPARTARKAPAAARPRKSPLDAADLSLRLDEAEYRRKLDKRQHRLRELEYKMYRARVPVILVYEGWDAAGKGGNIRRLTQRLDPRGYEVVPISAPNDAEKLHHYLWRFWTQLPKAGHLTVFDRSWYGRVLVERVEGFCSEAEWRRAYREINEMESHMVHAGAVLRKFWLHVSPEEQLRRFREREQIRYKRWKLTPEDWRNREKWPAYRAAVSDMLRLTNMPLAPWTVVESDCKWYARIRVLDEVIAAIEARLKG